jgi:hypothetical protein
MIGWRQRLQHAMDTRHVALLAAVITIAGAVRWHLATALRASVYGRQLVPDEALYDTWARRIAQGTTDGFPRDFAELPARVFGQLYASLGADPVFVRRLNFGLDLATCGLAYVCGRMLFGRRAGLFAAALYALARSPALYSATLLHTSLGQVLFASVFALCCALLTAPTHHRTAKLMGLGLALGLLVNTRANGAVLGVVALWTLCSAPGSLGNRVRAVLVSLLLVAPGYLVAASLGGSLSGPEGGYNLYFGNDTANSLPYYRPVAFASSLPEAQAGGFMLEAARRSNGQIAPAQAPDYWRGVVWSRALRAPGAFFAKLGAKALTVLHRCTADNDLDTDVVASHVPLLGWPPLATWLLLACGLAALPLLPPSPGKTLGALAALLYALTLVAFFSSERLRAPLLFLATPYAGAGLDTLLRADTANRRRLLAALTTLVVCAAAAHAPLRGTDQTAQAENLYGLLLLGDRQTEAAAAAYRHSLALDQHDSPGARIGLGSIAYGRGQLDEAKRQLQAVPDDYYEAASKYEWLGNLALRERDARAAAAAFGKSLAIDGSRFNAYKGLYIAQRLLGQDAQAQATDQKLHDALALVAAAEPEP